LGRAFPGAAIVQSSADGPRGVVDRVGAEPALVVATPGAEPAADGGYAAAALLDGWAAGGAGGLDASLEALARWLGAAALVRPAARGGEVILVGSPDPVAAQALIRWDPAGHATRDLADRAALRFPPTARMASITGTRTGVGAFIGGLVVPPEAEVLGPMPAGEEFQTLVRVPLDRTKSLLTALQATRAAGSVRKAEPVRVQVDPPL
jgi:primosomal protein N' (replication factor Y)